MLMLFCICIYECCLVLPGQTLITEQRSAQALPPLQSFCDGHLSRAGGCPCVWRVLRGAGRAMDSVWIPSATGSSSSSTGCTCPSPAWDLPFWGWHVSSSLQVFVGFPSCPYGLLLCWLCHPVMVWGDSSLLSALYTGPCYVEIGAALPKVAASEETAEIQPKG